MEPIKSGNQLSDFLLNVTNTLGHLLDGSLTPAFHIGGGLGRLLPQILELLSEFEDLVSVVTG